MDEQLFWQRLELINRHYLDPFVLRRRIHLYIFLRRRDSSKKKRIRPGLLFVRLGKKKRNSKLFFELKKNIHNLSSRILSLRRNCTTPTDGARLSSRLTTANVLSSLRAYRGRARKKARKRNTNLPPPESLYRAEPPWCRLERSHTAKKSRRQSLCVVYRPGMLLVSGQQAS